MISIVMTFYNRQALLDKTLESIHKSKVKDYELIIVDDASEPELICGEAKIIRIEKEDKWWNNPCIPFNMGIKAATGDVIILQNPECYHVGDILSFVNNHIRDGLYLSFSCYALNPTDTIDFHNGKRMSIKDRMYRHPENNGWYNHPEHRPVGYHFCSAITRRDMDRIGGFDERYADGISFDDDDLIYRIRKSMQVRIVRNPYVLHQYHTPFTYRKEGYMDLHRKNKQLYLQLCPR